MPYKDPARAKARRRNRDHIRRASVSDITADEELAMRQRARKCPLCSTWMTGKPNLPNSKHLDHILPLNQLGTHTHGNVRIICAACNLRRPKDGSDYIGPLTLWAQGPGVPVARKTPATCRSGRHLYAGNVVAGPNGKKRCRPCREAADARKLNPRRRCQCGTLFAARGNQFMCPDCIMAAAHRAAELHASGLNWKQVAAQVGYTTDEGARFAAKRIGYMPPPREPVEKIRQRTCKSCDKPFPQERYSQQPRCAECADALAWRAVDLYYGDRHTMRRVANELGFSSITSASNLIKSVLRVELPRGRCTSALAA